MFLYWSNVAAEKLTLLSELGIMVSVIQEPNLDPDARTVMGLLTPVSFPQPGGQRGRRIKKACMPTYLRGHTDARALRCFLYQITLFFFYNSSEIWHFIWIGSEPIVFTIEV